MSRDHVPTPSPVLTVLAALIAVAIGVSQGHTQVTSARAYLMPVLDGRAQGDEWLQVGINRMILPFGAALVQNDSANLYLLIDLPRDRGQQKSENTSVLVRFRDRTDRVIDYQVAVAGRSGTVTRADSATSAEAGTALRRSRSFPARHRSLEVRVPLVELPVTTDFSVEMSLAQGTDTSASTRIELAAPLALSRSLGVQAEEGLPTERMVHEDGTIELHYSDGKVVKKTGGCTTVTEAGGRTYTMCASAIGVQLNLPPLNGAALLDLPRWLDQLNDDLLFYIRTLLQNDQQYVDNYLKTESGVDDAYRRAERRTRFLHAIVR